MVIYKCIDVARLKGFIRKPKKPILKEEAFVEKVAINAKNGIGYVAIGKANVIKGIGFTTFGKANATKGIGFTTEVLPNEKVETVYRTD